MTYNPMLFQRGLSMAQFLERFGSESQCFQAAFTARWPNGFECPECGGRDYCLLSTRVL